MASKIKTQRAVACYGPDGDFRTADTEDLAGNFSVPVLVVPEPAVLDCARTGHIVTKPFYDNGDIRVCYTCGSVSFYLGGEAWSRWQRPTILRAGGKR